MYDLSLTGGLVVDGSGAAPYRANVYIRDGKITRITQENLPAAQILEVSGLAVTPGFIDPHSHADMVHMREGFPYSQLAQGVTMEIMGNCGTSVMPALPDSMEALNSYLEFKRGTNAFCSVTDYAEAGRQKGACLNYGTLIGHNNLRLAVMGFVNRDPEPAELEQMKTLLAREMQRGAFGMSLGLIYPPSAYGKIEELTELSRVVAKYDGILAVHMRNEGPKIFESVQEVLTVAENSGVHLHISHLKLMGKPQWGKRGQLLKMLTDAQNRGLNITCDQYPFTASSTNMNALVPKWAHEGGFEKLVQRLKEREGDVCQGIGLEMENRGGPDAVLVASTRGKYPQWEGKYVSQLAEEFGLDPVEAVRKVLIACDGSVSCIYFSMDKADMLEIMKQQFVCVGSDGTDMSHDPQLTKNVPHPRNYAAFVRFFQTVREENLMSLELAVRKVTGLPASILGVRDRGLLKEGMVADIAVFDPDTIGSDADFLESRVWPKGMRHVLVNGKLSICDGKPTGQKNGTVLLKEQ